MASSVSSVDSVSSVASVSSSVVMVDEPIVWSLTCEASPAIGLGLTSRVGDFLPWFANANIVPLSTIITPTEIRIMRSFEVLPPLVADANKAWEILPCSSGCWPVAYPYST